VEGYDYVLFISAESVDESWTGKGAPCINNKITNRPVAGGVFYNIYNM